MNCIIKEETKDKIGHRNSHINFAEKSPPLLLWNAHALPAHDRHPVNWRNKTWFFLAHERKNTRLERYHGTQAPNGEHYRTNPRIRIRTVPVTDPGGWGTRLQPRRGGQREEGGGKSHLCVGGAPNWRARIGIQRAGAVGLDQVARFGRRHAAAPPLLSVSLSFWSGRRGREKIEEEKGKRNRSRAAAKRVGWRALARPDPHEATRWNEGGGAEHGRGNLGGARERDRPESGTTGGEG